MWPSSWISICANLSRHLRRWRSLRRRRIPTDVTHVYSRELGTAWQLSKELIPVIASLEKQNGRLIDPQSLEFIANSVADISDRNVDRIAGECLNIHAHLARRLRDEFGWTVYLTMGSVTVLGDEWAGFDSSTARNYFRKRLSGEERFTGHCWLTLPTLEIIDATIQTTLARQTGKSELIGNITAQHVSNLTDAFGYRPTILGEEYAHAAFGVEHLR